MNSRLHIRVRKMFPLVEQGFSFRLRQRIRETVAKIQPCRMSAAFAEITVGRACGSRLTFSNGFNGDFRLPQQFVETAAGDRIAAAIDNRSRFEVGDRRDSPVGSVLDCFCKCSRFGFIPKDGNHRRGVKNHRGW